MKIKRIIEIDDSLYKRIKYRMTILEDIPCLCGVVVESKPYDDSGDLISREALKEAVKTRFDNSAYFPFRFLALIDNAPTVPIPNEQTAWEQGYEVGLAQGKQDRPQGEWVEFEGGYRCSNCDDFEVYTPNFCPNCGANMRGTNG